MALRFQALSRELRPMVRLAAPLALAELGWMAMGAVDTIMAGALGPAAIGAGSLGSMLFYPLAIAGTGILLGLDTLISQAFGARNPSECRRSLVDGVWLATAIAPALMLVIAATIPLMRTLGANPHVVTLFSGYMGALLWSIPPLLYYTACRRYLQATDMVKPVTFALVSANLVNIVGNYALMFGHWGLPALGLKGSGYATTLSRTYMAAVLIGAIVWRERQLGYPIRRIRWRPDTRRIAELFRLGLPAALQMAVEGAVFGTVTILAARLDEVSLAAHGLAVNVISITFMVPLGISSAAAVRVGHAMGRRDREGVAASGWSALLLSAAFMSAAGIALWTVPSLIVEVYTRDAAVIAAGATLLRIAAFFELFDGLQVVATGALRGLGETRLPMFAHLGGYWLVGMPVAWLLCFPLGRGAPGLWIGLSAALILIGAYLVRAWRSKVRSIGITGDTALEPTYK